MERKEQKMPEKDAEQRREDRKELFTGIVILYFVVTLFIIAVARKTKFLTYGQMSLLFLPLLVLFIIWEIRQYFNPNAVRRPSRTRVIVSCSMVGFVIVLTLFFNIANWMQ